MRLNKEIAECILERRLPRYSRVSRESGNLVVFQNAFEQRALWRRRLVLRQGGDPWKQRYCKPCGRLLPLEDFKEYKPLKRNTICTSCLKANARSKKKPGHTWAGTLYKTKAEISIIRKQSHTARWRGPNANYKARTELTIEVKLDDSKATCPGCGEQGIHADVDECIQAMQSMVQRYA